MPLSIADHHRYRLAGGERYRVQSQCGKNTYVFPVTQHGPRIYTVTLDGKFFYVGKTTQPIRARLDGARKAAGKNGYYGHRFMGVTEWMTLDLWTIEIPDTEDRDKTLEAIEAEVAFCCRVAGQWPLMQTEIHFQQSTEEHRRIAEEIYAGALSATTPAEGIISSEAVA